MTLTRKPAELVREAENSSCPSLLGKHPTWLRLDLDAVAEVLNGCAFSSTFFNRLGEGLPLIRIRDVGADSPSTFYSGPFEDRYLVHPGDILIGMDGDFRVAEWRGPVGLLNQRVCRLEIRNPEHYDKRFLVLVAQGYLDAIWAATSSITVKHLSSRSVQEIPLPLPPIAEQRRIVATLDDYLTRLDGAVSTLEKTRLEAGRLSLAILDSVVLGSQLPGDPIDVMRDLRISSVRFDCSELPELPSGWSWRAARDICESVFCGSTPKAHLMQSGHGEIPFIKVYNLTMHGKLDYLVRPTFIDQSTHNGVLKRSQVKPGDVLINIVGPPLGKTAVVPETYDEWNMNQAVVAFRAGEKIDPRWLSIALQSPFLIELLKKTAKATAGQFNISLSTCRDLPIPVPSIETQQLLFQNYDQIRSNIEMSIRYVTNTRMQTGLLRRSLLTEAFAGRLVPQNPHEEPAWVLLEQLNSVWAKQPTARRVGGAKYAKPDQEHML